MGRREASSLIVAFLSVVAVSASWGQTPRRLGAPTATLDQEFTGIDGVRELKDGRVVVLDAQDKAIHVVDLRTGSGARIGRDGDGPGEYRLPLEIWPVGDSAVVRDMARFGKMMVVTPGGAIGGFVSMLDSAFSTRNFNATSIDASGRYYALEYPNTINDSGRIVRWDLQRRRRDTVARFMAVTTPPSVKESDMARDASGRVVGYRPGPPRAFVAYNQWAVAGDGRVAIVLADPYRAVYVGLDGSRVVGQAVAYRPVPVTDAEKDEYRTDAARPRPMIALMRGGPVVGSYRKPPPLPEGMIWAVVLPPFPRDALRFASDGMFWVRRSTKAGAPTLYDVFDGAAKLAYQLEIPPRTKVVGFGTGSVYLARWDDDDLHYLERYALPATRPIRP